VKRCADSRTISIAALRLSIGMLSRMKRFESLDVWKVARQLSRSAYGLTTKPPLERHFELRNQIRRAAISIPANLAEGYGLATRPQLIRCVRISLGSVYELKTHLELARDLELAGLPEVTEVLATCDRTVALLLGLLRGLSAKGRC